MTGLAEWLLEAIAEDEAAATNGGKLRGDAWSAVEISPDRADWEVVGRGRGFIARPVGWEARHIARWDPARVLAECAAKRRIIDAALAYDEFDSGEWAFNRQLSLHWISPRRTRARELPSLVAVARHE